MQVNSLIGSRNGLTREKGRNGKLQNGHVQPPS